MLWIGVVPASPKHDDGFAVACKSRELLRESNIVGGEVEVRKSVVICAAGSKFLPPFASSWNPAVNARQLLTITLDS